MVSRLDVFGFGISIGGKDGLTEKPNYSDLGFADNQVGWENWRQSTVADLTNTCKLVKTSRANPMKPILRVNKNYLPVKFMRQSEISAVMEIFPFSC